MANKPLFLDETGVLLKNGVLNLMTDDTGKKIARNLAIIATAQAGEIHTITSWSQITEMVRIGVAREQFPVGTILNVDNEDYGTLKLRVCAVDHHKNPSDENTPTLTVEMLNGINSRPFDAAEALVYCPEALAAGTYNVNLPEAFYDAEGGGQTIQFTTTQNIPAKGQICLTGWGSGASGITSAKISTYASATSATAIESNIAVSVGSAGTPLGTADGTGNVNHVQRARYGNNNYRESAIRQWIGSEAAGDAWWEPKNVWDRPPAYAGQPGLLHGMDEEFLAAIQYVNRKVKTNKIYENPATCPEGTDSFYTVRDKSFLLCVEEVGFDTENSIAEGTVLDFYDGITNEERIKYDHASAGVARNVWLQSPGPSGAGAPRGVSTAGASSGNGAAHGNAASAAWTIY